MENFKKKIILNLFMLFIIIAISNAVYAVGSFTINKSTANLTTGNTTTITVTANNCAGQFNISSSNPSVATVSVSSIWLDNSSQTITITSKAAGTANISIIAADVTDTELNDVKGTKTCQITVSAPAPVEPTTPPSNNTGSGSNGGGNNSNSNNNSGSSNNNTRPTETTPRESSNSRLASLEITEGIISPEFNSDVTEYAISVPNDITVLNISAVAEDSAAEVEIVGNEELKIGENNIQIIVTAEDGSTTTYNILATRADEQLSLQSLSIYYIDENGQKVELKLNPTFALDVYEYNILEKLSNTVNKLEVEAIATKENAKIEMLL